MFKQVAFHGSLNERTGYGVHASRFSEALCKLVPVTVNGEGDVHISLLDVVTMSQTDKRWPVPSILYTVWEATEYPTEFLKRLHLYDQLWVVSEWEKACGVAQGIPEELIKVVPEGVDGEVYRPADLPCIDAATASTFDFLHVGQWQPRKSTLEICQAFLKAFPRRKDVRLYLSADTLFPSDDYKSTEERLKAHGLNDPRIIPIHFEEREAYVRRLQSAHVFVTCSRSEGWNLPLIEAMACGIPSICADFGGSTEYAGDALTVRIRELRKPQGIYGNWDVPGQWGEPDYDRLVEVMRDSYKNYALHKEKALKTSETIRTKFSWDSAAKKAYAVLEELSSMPGKIQDNVSREINKAEQDIRVFARKQGYEITTMKKKSVIFAVDSHPNTQERLDCLIETINQIKEQGFPIIVTTHYPLPPSVLDLIDYHIYDKDDISSGDDRPVYWRTLIDGKEESVQSGIPCHAAAALSNCRNGIDFCLGKYEWMYQMSSDTEVDLAAWLDKVAASDKDMICMKWEGQDETASGQLTAVRTELFDKITPRLKTWKEFSDFYGNHKFCSERGFYHLIMKHIGPENIEWISMDVANRFSQVDNNAWDDVFQCHFVDGPFLQIAGVSTREYDVSYDNPEDGEGYFRMKQKSGVWSRADIKYYRPWTISATLKGELKFRHTMDLKGRNVIISSGSKALGDTLAWTPYVEEFRKKHECNIFYSTWWNNILDYPEINFIKPGDTVENVYASYEVGCFDDQPNKNPTNWRLTPLQKVASDILGLPYEPLRAKLKYTPHKKGGNGHEPKPYVCFSEFSTMRNKLWNREGAWQKVIDHLISLGYDCVSISSEPSQLQGIIKHNGQSIEQTLTDVSGCEFYIGLNAGPTWIAYSLGKPTVMISGVSEEWNDAPNPYRVSVNVGCKPCFNDITVPISRDWEWCNSGKDYACTREITEELVIETITRLREDNGHAAKNGKVKQKSKRKHINDDARRKVPTPGNRNRNVESRTQAQV